MLAVQTFIEGGAIGLLSYMIYWMTRKLDCRLDEIHKTLKNGVCKYPSTDEEEE